MSKVLAKVGSIESIVLKALQGFNVHGKDNLSINDELHKYCKLKECIRKNTKSAVSYAEILNNAVYWIWLQ